MENITKQQASQRIEELRRALRRHNRLYYVEAAPEISDREYDALYAELAALEKRYPQLVKPDSPTQRVGGQPISGFETRAHSTPMLSLDNTYDDDDLRKFHQYVVRALGTENVRYTVEPKVDGVSVSIRYEQGVLTQALTRGNGVQGDDVTGNARTIQSIPLRLGSDPPPEVLEARGEVYMTKAGFAALNEHRRAAGETEFANARNATAGTLKLLDPRLVARRPLECVFYTQGEMVGMSVSTQAELLARFRALGLPTQPFCPVVTGLEGIRDAVARLERERYGFPYDIDGAVIKVNELAQRDLLGFTAKAPSWAKAFKYEAEQTETVLKEITVQVGRTGVLTPVAELEPVFLAGSTISRATLHNEDDIRRKDIRIGDTVVIEKAGDVIPAVVRVVPEKRPPGTEPFDLVEHIGGKCPSCGSDVVKDPQFVAWRCENLTCPAQSVRRVRHFASRDAMDIEALGGIVAEKLVASGRITEPLDLFAVGVSDLADLNLGTDEEPRVFGEKNATRLVQAVQRARALPLARWLHAVGIPNVGASTAYHIARVHEDLDAVAHSDILKAITELNDTQQDLKSLTSRRTRGKTDSPAPSSADADQTAHTVRRRLEQLGRQLSDLGLAKPGSSKAGSAKRYVTTHVGPKTARSVLDFFASPLGKAILQRLEQLHISPRGENRGGGPKSGTPTVAPLQGVTVVITGTLDAMTRDEAKEAIRALGGTAAGTVSAKTDYLVAGANTGATKTRKAQELNVPVLNEEQFLELLKQAGQTTGQSRENTPPTPDTKPDDSDDPRQLSFPF